MSLVSEDGGIAGEKVLYEGNSSMMDVIFSSFVMFCLACLMVGLIFPFMVSRATRYKITNQRVSLTKGVFSREEHELDLLRVKDVSLRKQSLGERMRNVGTIHVVATDVSTPTLELRLKRPREWRDRLRGLVQQAKKEAGVQYREDI